jgi:hypothetical protein
MDKVKEQLYEALRDIRENNAGSNERARGWYNAPDALAAYEQEKAAEQPRCPACAMGQNLERGEGTHLEGTAEHPRHEFVGAPQIVCKTCAHWECHVGDEPCNSCNRLDSSLTKIDNWQPMKSEEPA